MFSEPLFSVTFFFYFFYIYIEGRFILSKYIDPPNPLHLTFVFLFGLSVALLARLP